MIPKAEDLRGEGRVTRPVRVALIGCGRIAQAAHLPGLEKASGIELSAVCDSSRTVADAVARRYGVPAVCTDSSQVFSDPSVEAVIVAAPDRFHYELTRGALEGGKHVLVEKPLASTTEEGEKLVELVDRTALKVQVGAMKRHDAGLQWARQFIADSLGEARSFMAWYRIGDLRPEIEASLFPRVYSEEQVREQEAGFKADRERYLLATHGAHMFDTVRYLMGDVLAIEARHRGYGRDHAWTSLVTTASGAVGSVAITVDVPGLPAEGIEIFGSTGSLRVDTPFPFYRMASTVHAYANSQVVVPILTDGDPYQRQLEAFAAAIRGDLAPNPDVRDGLAALALIEATVEAVESGKEVTL
jgi:predicted dehydrogenase